MEQPLQPLSETVRDSENAQLVGVPVAVARDVDMAERERSCSLPNSAVAVVDGAVLKRKRGRPAKGIPKTVPPVRQEEDEEDVCFICFDGGSLVLCDRRGCPKAYHPACIKRDEEFFRSKAKWNCGWHICSVCQKASHYMCYTCTYSLCKRCTKDADFVCVRENKGLCGICMKTIMLIENSAQGNKEMCQVDFDDKSSWEYLFKVYWIYLKGKLSLTFDELIQAKNPWKSAAPICKVQTPDELYHLKDDKGSGSENSCIDIESNNLKNKKSQRLPKLPSKGDCFDRITSGDDNNVSMPECTKWASKELLEFVAHMKNGDMSPLSQFDVQTLLLEYVKKNNLRDPQQKSQTVCDSRLLRLFGKERVGHIEMLKLVEPHFFLKDNGPTQNPFGAGSINAVAGNGEAIDSCNKQLMSVNDKRCKPRKKADVLVPQNNPDAYAAIDTHNINLIYLRRDLMENLTEDVEKIHQKVVGSFVRIRISSSDQKQDMYRLVQVVGTSKVAEPYKIGTRTTDIKLEILNLNRKEVISIDEISNQGFSEDECKRLRQSIKYGLSKRLTVGEILDKANTLQVIRVNDLLDAEILRLNHLRDRASEKGHRKELKEYVEKLQLLNSPEERQRRLLEIPDVHSDPNLDSMFESDEDDGESDERKQDGSIWSKYLGLDRRERGPIFPKVWNGDLNDVGCKTQELPATHEPTGNTCEPKNNIKCDDTVVDDRTDTVVKSEVSNHTVDISSSLLSTCILKNDINCDDKAIDDSTNAVLKSEVSNVAIDISSPFLSTGMEHPVNDSMNDRSWLYQDPTGKIQGPFSMLQLHKWNASGHFPPDLRIWRMDEKQDNSILLNDALSGKCSKNVSLPFNSQLLSLGVSVTLDDKDNSEDARRNVTKNEISTDDQIIKQSREQKVDNTSTQSNNGRDESVRSNGWNAQLHVFPSLLSTLFPEKLNENPSDKLRKSHGIGGNPEDNGNDGSNRTSGGQSNSGRSYQKQSDSEENSGQSSAQNWRHPNVNSSSNCLVTTSAHVSATKPSPLKLGFDLHNPPSPPAFNTTWQAIIGEPNDFDESVSDLLAEVEAMESLGGLESPTSIMKCGEELTEGSKNDCLSFVAELSPMLHGGKGDALSSTGDLNLPCQPTAAEEPLRQADVHHLHLHHHHHHHHQRLSGEHSSRSSKVEVGTKSVSLSGNQWESGSENSPIVPSPATLGLATDTTWRLGLENTHLGWSGIDQGNVSVGWGVGQTAVQEIRSSNSYTSAVTPGFGDSQTRHGSERFSAPRDRAFQGHGRESGFSRGRLAYNRQPLYGVGNGGSYRPLPKGQRICKFYESGYCKKGASCGYLHP